MLVSERKRPLRMTAAGGVDGLLGRWRTAHLPQASVGSRAAAGICWLLLAANANASVVPDSLRVAHDRPGNAIVLTWQGSGDAAVFRAWLPEDVRLPGTFELIVNGQEHRVDLAFGRPLAHQAVG